MYLTELLILADQYEDKNFNTISFRLKIKRLTQSNFYNNSIKDNYYGMSDKRYCQYQGSDGLPNGNGYSLGFNGNSTGDGNNSNGDGWGFGYGHGKGIGDF